VIHRYAPSLPDESLSRGETVLRIGAYVLLGTVAALFSLLLVVILLSFLVTWLAN
jgi:hypothetical protein